MAEAVKSALFVDLDSLQRSMNGGQVAGPRVAERASAWVAALEAGQLFASDAGRRTFSVKRCYAGPNVRGKQRDALTAAGFTVVDSNASDTGRGSADLHLAMDAIDVLIEPGGPDEFVLLVSGGDLSPLLKRLKSAKRIVAIYADRTTPPADRALVDMVVDSGAFATFVASDEVPGETGNASSAADRADIEAFARRIHAATNIPLFSPKTFSDLFRHLTEEIRANGYHFQSTARNVADRMTTAGRNVTRRQVVFIVKGLALKGHVFSTDDTPETLAEVFREQARYLITNAGIQLDPRQEQLLSAWFVSRPAPRPAPRQTPRPAPVPAQAEQPAAVIAAPPPPPPAPPQAPPPRANGVTPPPAQARPAPPAPEKRTPPPAPPPPPPPQPVAAKPAPQPVKPVEMPRSAAKPAPPIRLSPSPAAREEAKAIIAARIAASAKLKPSKSAPPAKAAKPAAKAAPRRGPDPNAEALESSILAAIAEAVDVLVDDSGEDEVIVPEPAGRRRAQAAPEPEQDLEPEHDDEPLHEIEVEAEPVEPADEPEQEPERDGGDIGDQIQRIIASYNRNRDDD